MKIVELTFDEETGETTIETSGFTGPECKDVTKFIKDSLGTPVKGSQKLKPEFFQNPTTTVKKDLKAGGR